MRSIVTILFIFFSCVFAQAQEATVPTKAKTVRLPIKVDGDFRPHSSDLNLKLARIYIDRNARVKKELHFSAKRAKAKLA
ncbi:MAG: hypothetical protein ACR2MT_04095 [Aurantibacter sp.]